VRADQPPSAPPTTQDAAVDQTLGRYALVVGTNTGGPGQGSLRYAEQDAQRVAEVWTTLGGVPAAQITRLLEPTAAQLQAAIDGIRGLLAAHALRGEPTRFYFYYSGHARADALNLGSEQLPLADLRAQLAAMPATVSVVVLDACQSGAFSRVKGADAATDFSFNSVQRLDTEGMVVIASSSGRELSQESDELKAGYFTHHWLAGLRGAGDQNGDGRVTLSEAYQYAYNRTLATTAATQVGEQHATLETSLKGKGDLDLTHPGDADARVRLPANLSARVLVQSLPSWTPLAEIEKVRGQPLELALPSGAYAATLRQASKVYRCTLKLVSHTVTTLTGELCTQSVAAVSAAKGGGSDSGRYGLRIVRWGPPPKPRSKGGDEGFVVELLAGIAAGPQRDDSYSHRLGDFGFIEKSSDLVRYNIGLGYRVKPFLVLGLSYANLDGARYARTDGSADQTFKYTSTALGLWAQADWGFGELRQLNLFARAGGGPSFTWTTFDAIVAESAFADQNTSLDDRSTTTRRVNQSFTGYHVFAGIGFEVMPLEYLGFMVEERFSYAPVLQNALGETHDTGGFETLVGLRLRTWN
jgi:hypothetical protein